MLGKRHFKPLFCVMTACFMFSQSVTADTVPPAYVTIAANEGVPEKLLFAMAMVESRNRYQGKTRPWPWTLNVNGKPYFFDTQQQAIQVLDQEIAIGNENVAIGIMQIFWRYHKDSFQRPMDVLDPYTNVSYGARYLKKLFNQYGDWVVASGKYYTAGESMQSRAKANGYAKKVMEQWEKLQ